MATLDANEEFKAKCALIRASGRLRASTLNEVQLQCTDGTCVQAKDERCPIKHSTQAALPALPLEFETGMSGIPNFIDFKDLGIHPVVDHNKASPTLTMRTLKMEDVSHKRPDELFRSSLPVLNNKSSSAARAPAVFRPSPAAAIAKKKKKKVRAAPRVWTPQEDAQLRLGVSKYGACSWKNIAAEFVPSRSSVQCLQRWKKALDPNITKGPWSEAEDAELAAKVRDRERAKSARAAVIKGRTEKQCRERWNVLLKRGSPLTRFT